MTASSRWRILYVRSDANRMTPAAQRADRLGENLSSHLANALVGAAYELVPCAAAADFM